MSDIINLKSRRAVNARFGKFIGKTGYKVLLAIGATASVLAIILGITGGIRLAMLLASPALLCFLPAIWWKRQLSVLPAGGNDLTGLLSVDILARLKPGMTLSPQAIWNVLSDHWQAIFILNHLLLGKDTIGTLLSSDPAEAEKAFKIARDLAVKNESPTIELGCRLARQRL